MIIHDPASLALVKLERVVQMSIGTSYLQVVGRRETYVPFSFVLGIPEINWAM